MVYKHNKDYDNTSVEIDANSFLKLMDLKVEFNELTGEMRLYFLITIIILPLALALAYYRPGLITISLDDVHYSIFSAIVELSFFIAIAAMQIRIMVINRRRSAIVDELETISKTLKFNKV